MKLSIPAICAVAGLAAPAAAQPSMYLIKVVNLEAYTNSASPFFVGTNPRGGALVRQTFHLGETDQNVECLYIAGFNSSGAAINAGMVKIEDAMEEYGPRVNVSVPGSLVTIPAQGGCTGMDYRARSGSVDVDGGLVVAWDLGTSGASQQKIWDVDAGHTPTLIASAPSGGGFRGVAGPAWDMGFGGSGFEIVNGVGKPVVAALDFSASVAGPFGLNPNTLSAAPASLIYSPTGSGLVLPGPLLNGPDPFGFAVGGTVWRDIDVQSDSGLIVARAFNDVVIANRNVNNTASIVKVIDGPDVAGSNSGAQVAQECAVMHGFQGGDLIAWNSRPSGNSGQPLGASLRFADLQGHPQAVALLDPATELPTTWLPTDGNAMLGLYWDRGMLVVVDGSSAAPKAAYIFQQCLADVNHDGVVDLLDFFAFFDGFDTTTAPADVNHDGQIDLIDFFQFLTKFDESC